MIILYLAVAVGATVVIKVTYETTKDAQAINWLTEAQTTTKTLKYLFT